MLGKVKAVLGNPLVQQGLKISAPQVAMALDLLAVGGSLFSSGRKGPKATDLVDDVDEELALQIEILAKPDLSDVRKRNTEIRVHALLGILNKWSKYR